MFCVLRHSPHPLSQHEFSLRECSWVLDTQAPPGAAGGGLGYQKAAIEDFYQVAIICTLAANGLTLRAADVPHRADVVCFVRAACPVPVPSPAAHLAERART
jgi:hypothetical protein